MSKRPRRSVSSPWVMLHMVEPPQSGHLDILRELNDEVPGW